MGSQEGMHYNICLVGGGGVGMIAAVVLEKSGRASVTAVLRSKYAIIKERGWDIESVDHGILKGWRPSRGMDTLYHHFSNADNERGRDGEMGSADRTSDEGVDIRNE